MTAKTSLARDERGRFRKLSAGERVAHQMIRDTARLREARKRRRHIPWWLVILMCAPLVFAVILVWMGVGVR